MAAALRGLARAVPSTLLRQPRRRLLPVQSVRWCLGTASAAPTASTATASSTQRWYSASSGEDGAAPASSIWSFDDVRQVVEASKKPSEGESQKVVIVDVREPDELHSTGKIPGAINIPITSAVQSFHLSDDDFQDMYGFDRPPRDATLLFYCKAGVRARSAAALAKHAGWNKVGEYPGSWLDWESQGGPVEKA
ncbi:Rhodanese domain protein [Drechmeria coniospora]|uniref:Rhodanese domain protein n=1 Tax=Drechmeria coniospora TaxID=98403 RepID=A0A151GRH0_DRECN|nr:Rhodanese domain protein [Drechmeria coniospora]KYK59699.1 Rhodanese domain protein [Drechmeria coniospora]ODA78507.1 hypothetical protein RJ55_05888 [Drechmeria coniospora]